MHPLLPKLLYGTAWKKEKTAQCVEMALSCGFRGIDTACQPKHYDEELVGIGLQKGYKKGLKREDLFIQTKFTPLGGQDPQTIPYNPHENIEKQIADSFEVSKKNLHTHYIDSLLLHSPLFPYPNMLRAYKAMEGLYDKGEVLHLGISNCYDLELLKQVYMDANVKPSFVQNRFYADTAYDKELRTWCIAHHVAYQGFWTLTANPHILQSEPMRLLTQKYGKTEAQLFYRFLTCKGITPLIGSTSKQHLEEAMAIFDFELQREDIKMLERVTGLEPATFSLGS